MPKRQDEFEQTAMPYTRGLLRFALRLTRDRGVAEDLVQDTLLLAWRNFSQFKTGTNLRAWLYRILVNAHRTQGRKAMNRIVLAPMREVGSSDQTQESMEVRQALDRLPEEQRAVLLLAVLEGFTCREIAEILSIPMGTAMSRLSRSRGALREMLVLEQETR